MEEYCIGSRYFFFQDYRDGGGRPVCFALVRLTSLCGAEERCKERRRGTTIALRNSLIEVTSLPLEFAGRWHSHISLFLNDPNYITKFLEILTPL